MFLIDIGYGITNIAALSQDGLISGININLGGGNIDRHIIDELADARNIKVGALTAERIKNTVGSLLNDDNKMTVAGGQGYFKRCAGFRIGQLLTHLRLYSHLS